MKIVGLPALTDSYENYIWVLFQDQQAWVVDPGESTQVIDFLEQNNLVLQSILLTHYHHDHVNGVPGLKTRYPDAKVIGPELTDNPYIQQRVQQGDEVVLSSECSLNVLDTPGHTHDHIAYFNNDWLFCGDTLFTGGCGKNFTNNAEDFSHSILKLRALPNHTGFYCAHEYTESNLKFAYLLEPENENVLQRIANTEIHYPDQNWTGQQSSLELEKATNPFLRFDLAGIQEQLLQRGAENTPAGLFDALRTWKDQLDQSGELNRTDFKTLQQQCVTALNKATQ